MDEDKDYTYLKEKDFDVKTSRGILPGLLAEIEPSIGITIMSKEDTKLYIYCLRGPSANVELFKDHPEVKEIYERIFDIIVEEIEKGSLDLNKTSQAERGASYLITKEANSESCPFT